MLNLKENIKIKPDVDGGEFLMRLKSLMQELQGYALLKEERLSSSQGSFQGLKLALKRDNQQLEVALLSNGKVVDAILWSPQIDDFALYAETTREVMHPLLKNYNRRHGTRIRLFIPHKGRPKPLPPGAHARFDLFKETLGLSEFYLFVIYCHHYRVLLDRARIEELLLQTGLDSERVKELTTLYFHGREILKLKKAARRNDLAWRESGEGQF